MRKTSHRYPNPPNPPPACVDCADESGSLSWEYSGQERAEAYLSEHSTSLDVRVSQEVQSVISYAECLGGEK